MDLSIDLRRRLVAAYKAGRSGTYAVTAKVFGVGEATVSRLLRRQRETGDVQHKPKGGNRPRLVDLAWLQEHCRLNPDARLFDRIDAWKEHTGESVSYGAMWSAVHAVGWSFKKKRRLPLNATTPGSRRSVKASSRVSQR